MRLGGWTISNARQKWRIFTPDNFSGVFCQQKSIPKTNFKTRELWKNHLSPHRVYASRRGNGWLQSNRCILVKKNETGQFSEMQFTNNDTSRIRDAIFHQKNSSSSELMMVTEQRRVLIWCLSQTRFSNQKFVWSQENTLKAHIQSLAILIKLHTLQRINRCKTSGMEIGGQKLAKQATEKFRKKQRVVNHTKSRELWTRVYRKKLTVRQMEHRSEPNIGNAGERNLRKIGPLKIS